MKNQQVCNYNETHGYNLQTRDGWMKVSTICEVFISCAYFTIFYFIPFHPIMKLRSLIKIPIKLVLQILLNFSLAINWQQKSEN
jgi:hypothetical protein